MILALKNKLKKDVALKELISGGSVSFLMQSIGMLLGYILMALIANYFGSRVLGVYSFIYTTLALVTVISALGLDMVILKIAGQHENRSAMRTLKLIYWIVIPLSLVLGFVLAGIGIVDVNSFFNETEYKDYFIFAGCSLIFTVVLAINIEYLRARGDISNSEFLRNIFRPFSAILLILTICLFRYDLYIPGYTLLLSSMLACGISVYWIFSRYTDDTCSVECDPRDAIKPLITSGLPMQTSMLAFYLIGNMVIFFVARYENSSSVGLILVSIKLAGLVNMPLMVLNKVCASRFSKLYWADQYNELQTYLSQVTKMAFFAALVAASLLIIFSKAALSVFGSDFVEAKKLLFIIIFGQLVSCASGSVGIFMMMTGNERAYRNIAIVVAFFSFVAYRFVVPVYGVSGAAYVLACSQAALNIISVIYIKLRLGFVTMYVPFVSRQFFNKP